MDRIDLRTALIRALRTSGRKPNERANPVKFLCPRHSDKHPSAWLGDGAWGCFACDFEEPLATLAEILGVAHTEPKRGLTIEAYAEHKGFSIADLQRWGVHTGTGKFGDDVVVIPYRDAAGRLLRSKHRTRTKGSFWAMDGSDTHLYGLDILAKAKATDPVILVEGESDCHACWHAHILALGVPGATSWKAEWAEHIKGRTIYAWQEPGEAGAKFTAKIAESFPDVRVMQSSESVKDLADLFRDTGKGFKQAITARMAEALPFGKNAPTIPFDAIAGPTLDLILADKLKPIDAVPTPLPMWNQNCRDDGGGVGLARGWHIVIGGIPGHGKSLVGLNLAAAAIKHGERVGFCSLEMSQKQLTTRLLAIVTGRSVRRMEQGSAFDEAYWRDASREMDQLRERTGGVVVTNRARLSRLADVAGAMRYLHEVHGCRYLIVDYLQLVATMSRATDLLRSIEEVSHTVRDIGGELGVVTVGLSQFNRQTSANVEDPPTPQGLMGGSPLENDSDQVLLLDHSQYERDHLNNGATTRLILGKNRHGGLAAIPVRWSYRDLSISERVTGELPPSAPREPEPPDNRGEAWEPEASADLTFLPGAV